MGASSGPSPNTVWLARTYRSHAVQRAAARRSSPTEPDRSGALTSSRYPERGNIETASHSKDGGTGARRVPTPCSWLAHAGRQLAPVEIEEAGLIRTDLMEIDRREAGRDEPSDRLEVRLRVRATRHRRQDALIAQFSGNRRELGRQGELRQQCGRCPCVGPPLQRRL